MRNLLMTALALLLGSGAAPATARELEVEVEVLHIGGLLTMNELESLLADVRLAIEAVYEPTRLIEGRTARRERVLPLGSKLFPISQTANLAGAQIERNGRSLRFKVADAHPSQADYRLHSLTLRAPVARGIGRPQPAIDIGLLNPVPRSGAQENVQHGRYGVFDLGLKVRHRWNDAKGTVAAGPAMCLPEVQSTGDGQYFFRPQHRVAGLFQFLASDVQSDPPSRQRDDRRSLRMRAPFPEPLAGFELSRNHLIQLQVQGVQVERLSIYGGQNGPGECLRTRVYEALFAGGQPVEAQVSTTESGCGARDGSRHIEAAWLEDGRLTRYHASNSEGSRTWYLRPPAIEAQCGAQDAPPADAEVEALKAELRRIRESFRPI